MSAAESSETYQALEEVKGAPVASHEVEPVRARDRARVQREIVLAPGNAPSPPLEEAIDLLMLSVDDAVQLLEIATKGSTSTSSHGTVLWSNGSRTDLGNPGQLREVAELGNVQGLSSSARYSDGTGMSLYIIQGEVSLHAAEVHGDSLARKRFHEIKNLVASLSAPKAKRTRPFWQSLSQDVGVLGVVIIIWSLFSLPSLTAFAYLFIGLALAVPLAGFFVTAMSERRMRSSWLVKSYPQPKQPTPWGTILQILLAALGVGIAVLAWLLPR